MPVGKGDKNTITLPHSYGTVYSVVVSTLECLGGGCYGAAPKDLSSFYVSFWRGDISTSVKTSYITIGY